MRRCSGRDGSALLTLGVASVWLVHGLYNKVLHGSPRHLAIVQAVPGLSGSVGEQALVAIGAAEIAVAVWVLSGWLPHACAAVQTVLLLSMNVVELTVAPQFLLWPAGLIPVNMAFLAAAWVVAESREPRGWFARLRRHPVPIEAHLQDCITLTYALPASVLRRLLPPGLELDTFNGFGFVAVALVRATSLRPAGWPRWCGQHFFLAGYRVFTTFRLPDGRTIRGLQILRSDADRWPMVAGGNLLTHYNYHRCDAVVEARAGGAHVTVRTADRGGDLDVGIDGTRAQLPPGSPFASWRDARRFAGPLPYTFDYEAETHAIVVIRATRTNWRPAPVTADVRRVAFFDRPEFAGCAPVLAAAFHVTDIDYRWERGVRYGLDAPDGWAA